MLYISYLLTIVVLVASDQFSKYLITYNFKDTSSAITIVDNFFKINFVKNYGAGFSILQNQTVFLIIVSIAACIIICYLLFKTNKKEVLNRISYLLIIGGTIGNLIDRLRFNYVIDFLDFYIFGYDFPVFNLADSFITIGAFLLIFSIIMESLRAKDKNNCK